MDDTPDTLAEPTTGSLALRVPTLPRPSGPGAALPSSTKTGTPSSETSETILILMVLLQSITAEVLSGDVMELVMFKARSTCEKMGIDKAKLDEVLEKFGEFSAGLRARNPLSGMF